jgi:hypothetical protein
MVLFGTSARKSQLLAIMIILSYALIAVFLLYSFPYDFTKQVPGDGGDGYQFLWDLWWVRFSLVNLHSNPYFSNYVFYPNAQSLYFHSLMPLGGIIAIPFQDAFGLFFSYNFLLLLGYAFGGFGAYSLAYYFTKNRHASYLSGLIFAFSPYHLAHTLGHLNLVSFEAVPFYILFLFKLKDTRSFRYSVYAAVSLLIATFLGDLYYAFILTIFTVLFLVYGFLLEGKALLTRKFMAGLVLTFAIFFLVASPVMLPMVAGMSNGQYNYAKTSINAQAIYSTDLAAFFIPKPENYFLSNFAKVIGQQFGVNFGGAENGAYIGYTVMALVLYTIVKVRKNIEIWLLLTGTFALLSLGPVLHVMGRITFGSNTVIPLPSFLIHYLPGGLVFQVPARFMVVAYLGLGVLVALGITYMIKEVGILREHRTYKILFVLFLSGLILVEYNMSPYPLVYDYHVPQFYYQLREMEGAFSVLDLPVNGETARYMYYNTVSEKPMLIGSLSRINPAALETLYGIPLVSLTSRLFSEHSISAKDLSAYTNTTNTLESLTKLRSFNTSFIILHNISFDQSGLKIITNYLTAVVGKPYYSDQELTVFKL